MTDDDLEERMWRKYHLIQQMIEDEDFDIEEEMEQQQEFEAEEPMTYQDFISQCMKGGNKTMKQCAEEWHEYKKQIKEEAPTTEEVEELKKKREELQDVSKRKVPEVKEVEQEEGVYNDVLVVTEGCTSCEKVANILADDILSDRIKVVEAKTGQGQNIVAQMPNHVTIPFYCVEKKKGYEHRPLRRLFEKYKE